MESDTRSSSPRKYQPDNVRPPSSPAQGTNQKQRSGSQSQVDHNLGGGRLHTNNRQAPIPQVYENYDSRDSSHQYRVEDPYQHQLGNFQQQQDFGSSFNAYPGAPQMPGAQMAAAQMPVPQMQAPHLSRPQMAGPQMAAPQMSKPQMAGPQVSMVAGYSGMEDFSIPSWAKSFQQTYQQPYQNMTMERNYAMMPSNPYPQSYQRHNPYTMSNHGLSVASNESNQQQSAARNPNQPPGMNLMGMSPTHFADTSSFDYPATPNYILGDNYPFMDLQPANSPSYEHKTMPSYGNGSSFLYPQLANTISRAQQANAALSVDFNNNNATTPRPPSAINRRTQQINTALPVDVNNNATTPHSSSTMNRKAQQINTTLAFDVENNNVTAPQPSFTNNKRKHRMDDDHAAQVDMHFDGSNEKNSKRYKAVDGLQRSGQNIRETNGRLSPPQGLINTLAHSTGDPFAAPAVTPAVTSAIAPVTALATYSNEFLIVSPAAPQTPAEHSQVRATENSLHSSSRKIHGEQSQSSAASHYPTPMSRNTSTQSTQSIQSIQTPFADPAQDSPNDLTQRPSNDSMGVSSDDTLGDSFLENLQDSMREFINSVPDGLDEALSNGLGNGNSNSLAEGTLDHMFERNSRWLDNLAEEFSNDLIEQARAGFANPTEELSDESPEETPNTLTERLPNSLTPDDLLSNFMSQDALPSSVIPEDELYFQYNSEFFGGA